MVCLDLNLDLLAFKVPLLQCWTQQRGRCELLRCGKEGQSSLTGDPLAHLHPQELRQEVHSHWEERGATSLHLPADFYHRDEGEALGVNGPINS